MAQKSTLSCLGMFLAFFVTIQLFVPGLVFGAETISTPMLLPKSKPLDPGRTSSNLIFVEKNQNLSVFIVEDERFFEHRFLVFGKGAIYKVDTQRNQLKNYVPCHGITSILRIT